MIWNGLKQILLITILLFLMTSMLSAEISELEKRLIKVSDSTEKIAQNALDKKESGRLAALFANDAVVKGENERTIKGNFTIRATLAMLLMAVGRAEIDINRSSLRLTDSTGYEKGSFIFREFKSDSKIQTYEGTYNAVWKLEKGVWKIGLAEGRDKPPAPQKGK